MDCYILPVYVTHPHDTPPPNMMVTILGLYYQITLGRVRILSIALKRFF